MACDYSPADIQDIRIRWTTGLREKALWVTEARLLLLDCTVTHEAAAQCVAEILVPDPPQAPLAAVSPWSPMGPAPGPA